MKSIFNKLACAIYQYTKVMLFTNFYSDVRICLEVCQILVTNFFSP